MVAIAGKADKSILSERVTDKVNYGLVFEIYNFESLGQEMFNEVLNIF
jgi:hypothetical protein